MHLTDLSDEALVCSLRALCGEGNRLLARIIVHLGEVEERRLHLKAACSSMFDYCVRRLGMSEGAAFRRIAAARLTRRFPSLLTRIESGELHLTALVLIREIVTAANVDALASEVAGRSKREVQEIVARHAPKPDVPATIRKLPERTTTTTAAIAPAVPPVPAMMPTPAPMPMPMPTPTTLAAPMPATTPVRPIPPPAPPGRIEPLSDARYKLQLTATGELRAKLERATDLMRHRNPTGDMAVVIERALDALLATLEKERLGASGRPKTDARTSRRVSRAVRREVFARDGQQCTFRDAEENRCPARTLLELDHVTPRARGGADDATNLRVRCRAHNALYAEEVFGRAHVAARIHLRQQQSKRRAGVGVTADLARAPATSGRPPQR